jgi:hypothetical protein
LNPRARRYRITEIVSDDKFAQSRPDARVLIAAIILVIAGDTSLAARSSGQHGSGGVPRGEEIARHGLIR